MKRNPFTSIEKMKTRKKLFIGLILLLILLFIAFNRDLFNLIINGEIETIHSQLIGKLLYAYTFMLLIMIIQNSFTIIPLILVITVNIALFGVVNGFLWSWFTSVIAGALVFLCVRYFFQDWLLKRVDSAALAKVEHKGFIYVLQARLFPFVPTSLINILAAISSVRFHHFILATALGNFLYFFVLALVPAGFLSAKINEYELGMILFLVVTILFALKKFYDKKKREQLDTAAGKQINEPEKSPR